MITFVYGCMKSGKTKFIFDFIKENNLIQQDFDVIKPSRDTRDGEFLVTRAYDEKIKCTLVKNLSDFESDKKYIFIDEYQFFQKEELEDFLRKNKDKNIIVAGLDKIHTGEYWGNFEVAEKCCDKEVQLFAKCENKTCSGITCDSLHAEYTKLHSHLNDLIQIENEFVEYVPMCKHCFYYDGPALTIATW